jgi:hypothetical protein
LGVASTEELNAVQSGGGGGLSTPTRPRCAFDFAGKMVEKVSGSKAISTRLCLPQIKSVRIDVQTSKNWACNDAASFRDSACEWRVLVQGKVRARLIVIIHM